jgi:hypothetical protein
MGDARQSGKDARAMEGVPPKRIEARRKSARVKRKPKPKSLARPAMHEVAEFEVDAASLRHVRLRQRVVASFVVLGVGVVALAAVLAVAAVVPLVVMFVVLVVGAGSWLGMPARVSVGADGVLVRWAWQRRFIPIGDIDSVELDFSAEAFEAHPRARLVLRRKTGGSDDIHVGGHATRLDYHESWEERRRLAIRMKRTIESAMRAAQEAATGLDAPALPPRGSKSSEEWIVALRAVPRQDSYRRQAAPACAELWRLACDVTADPARRAAAAVALGPMLDDEGRKRLRILAEATAAPELHDAFVAVSGRHDLLLAVALDELELKTNVGKPA